MVESWGCGGWGSSGSGKKGGRRKRRGVEIRYHFLHAWFGKHFLRDQFGFGRLGVLLQIVAGTVRVADALHPTVPETGGRYKQNV